MKTEYIIQMLDSIIYYDGTNMVSENITDKHFGPSRTAMTYDTKEEALLDINLMSEVYERLLIIETYY